MFTAYNVTDPLIDSRTDLPLPFGWLYAVVNPTWPGFVKIGQTTNLSHRLANYQTGSPYADYQMIAYSRLFQDVLQVEKALHHTLKDCRAKGEWFRLSERQAIEAIRTAERNEPAPKKAKHSFDEEFAAYGEHARRQTPLEPVPADDPFEDMDVSVD